MTDNNFFNEQQEQSFVKTQIVSKYFDAWANVILATLRKNPRSDGKIAYIDLFAGPGRYKDGAASTPIKIIEKALQKEEYRKNLLCIFNDKDENNTESLKSSIFNIDGIDKLKYKPQIYSHEVGEEIVKMFEEMRLVPTLFFVDPWGYKGLSLRLINSVLKDWGCDCIFFFNYNRINMAMSNEFVKEHMTALFGPTHYEIVNTKLKEIKEPKLREYIIIEELCTALKELGGNFTLPFCFKNANGKRTSHHLIFVSKDFKGYDIMKDIMARESSSNDSGVPSFEYNPVDKHGLKQGLLFNLTRPISELGDQLLRDFIGQSIRMIDIYTQHSVDRPYIKRNYKAALIKLEAEGKITADKHRKNSFGDSVRAHFPKG